MIGVYQHPDNLGLFLGRVITDCGGGSSFYEGGWNCAAQTLYAALLPLTVVLILSFLAGSLAGGRHSLLVMIIAAGSRRGLLVFG